MKLITEIFTQLNFTLGVFGQDQYSSFQHMHVSFHSIKRQDIMLQIMVVQPKLLLIYFEKLNWQWSQESLLPLKAFLNGRATDKFI
jgi:hypothetical protein